jgi:hypothetical protein
MLKLTVVTTALVFGSTLCGQGIVTTLGGGTACSYGGDGNAVSQAQMCNPSGAVSDYSGSLYFADTANWRIRKIAANGTITTIGGNGVRGTSGDGGSATAASLGTVYQVAVSMTGRLCFGDVDAHKHTRFVA